MPGTEEVQVKLKQSGVPMGFSVTCFVGSTWELESGDMSVSLGSTPVFIFSIFKRQKQYLPHGAITTMKCDPAFIQ